jgi:cytochrome b
MVWSAFELMGFGESGHMTEQTVPEARTVRVWDVPTRIFHWALVVLVLVSWFTGEEEGVAAQVHRYSGEAIAGLLVFRVIWGFVGGQHARFADFGVTWPRVAAHIADLTRPRPPRYLGHNPIGAIAVYLLLLNVAVIVIAGLFSAGEGKSGPFAGLWGLELSEVHELAFRILQGLVVIHVLGAIMESLIARDPLILSMFTGAKKLRPGETGEDARNASLPALLIAILLAAGVSGVLMALPQSTLAAEQGEEESEPEKD